MMNIKRLVERAREILKKENTFRLFTKNTVWAVIVLLFANTLFAQFNPLYGTWNYLSGPATALTYDFTYGTLINLGIWNISNDTLEFQFRGVQFMRVAQGIRSSRPRNGHAREQ
jgi:hypothetical protein